MLEILWTVKPRWPQPHRPHVNGRGEQRIAQLNVRLQLLKTLQEKVYVQWELTKRRSNSVAGKGPVSWEGTTWFTHLPSQPFSKHCKQGLVQGTWDTALPKTPTKMVLYSHHTWLQFLACPVVMTDIYLSIISSPKVVWHLIIFLTTIICVLDQKYVLHHTNSQCKSPERSDFHTKMWMADTSEAVRNGWRNWACSYGEREARWCMVSDLTYVNDWEKRVSFLQGKNYREIDFNIITLRANNESSS